jgi:hypothetical protein
MASLAGVSSNIGGAGRALKQRLEPKEQFAPIVGRPTRADLDRQDHRRPRLATDKTVTGRKAVEEDLRVSLVQTGHLAVKLGDLRSERRLRFRGKQSVRRCDLVERHRDLSLSFWSVVACS